MVNVVGVTFARTRALGVEADVAGFAARSIEEQNELVGMVACVTGRFGDEDMLLAHIDVCRAVYASVPKLFQRKHEPPKGGPSM